MFLEIFIVISYLILTIFDSYKTGKMTCGTSKQLLFLIITINIFSYFSLSLFFTFVFTAIWNLIICDLFDVNRTTFFSVLLINFSIIIVEFILGFILKFLYRELS